MTRKIAFLFPGQGSQYVGMGLHMAETFQEAKEVFEQADEICRKPISRFCFEGPMEELTLTVNLQPAVTAVSLSCLAALLQAGIRPEVVAGHSLGEYAALVAAGVLSREGALALVQKRGELMHREALAHPGAMAAIIGLPIEEVRMIVDEARDTGVLGIANHNTAEQIVITGERDPVSRAVVLAKERKARAVPLKVSGAWHSRLMENAVKDFRSFMEDVSFSEPRCPVLFNATAEEETDPRKIKDLMANQLISPVRWYDIILRMHREGIDAFVEVGPKNVLSGLVKKILPPDQEDILLHNVGDPKGLHSLLDALK
ncbi:MAG: ACP S-malonyltransferase [Deltaproteobacteria bacterium]|nr:ACP S-malonyltransferase [Deltaproteobacteria bacterium]MBW2302485.1 ACP S-malonyltransferase [Deltaproteobacteria bacterium]